MFWAPKSELLGGFGALFGILGGTLSALGRFFEDGGLPGMLGAGFGEVRGPVPSPQTPKNQKDQTVDKHRQSQNHK